MKSMKDYYNSYLKWDVLLFRKFRNSSLKNYGLCPNHYLSARAMRWDDILNITTIELEIIADPDKYLVFEKG